MTVVAIATQRHGGLSRSFSVGHASGVKRSQPQNVGMYARQILPTDAQGSMTLTLSNVIVGSRYRVELLSDGSLVAEGDATTSIVGIVLSWYFPNREVRIKVRKGSAAPFYRPYDTQATIGAADQSLFISQIADE